MVWEPTETAGMVYGVTCPVSRPSRKTRAPAGADETLMLPCDTCGSQATERSAAAAAASTAKAL